MTNTKAKKAAEMKVSVAFHGNGSVADILVGLAERAEAMGDHEAATEYRERALLSPKAGA